MTLAKIVYASMTGNTEEISEIIEDELNDAGIEVEREECGDVDSDFFDDADICIVATYTYGDGELPFEIEDIYDDLESENLSGKIFGVVGSGDLDYGDFYCQSAKDFRAQLLKTGATEGAPMVFIEHDADGEDTENLQKFVEQLIVSAES